MSVYLKNKHFESRENIILLKSRRSPFFYFNRQWTNNLKHKRLTNPWGSFNLKPVILFLPQKLELLIPGVSVPYCPPPTFQNIKWKFEHIWVKDETRTTTQINKQKKIKNVAPSNCLCISIFSLTKPSGILHRNAFTSMCRPQNTFTVT